MSAFKYLETQTDRLAYLHEEGEGEGYLFLNGRHMELADEHPVASCLYEFFTSEDVRCTFFDYGGWGASTQPKEEDDDLEAINPRPKFEMARWLQNGLDMLDHTTPEGGQQVLVGYSLGFWLALAMWFRRPEKVAGIVGISPSIIKYMEVTGNKFIPDENNQPLIRLELAETPVKHPRIIASPLEIDVPIRLMHGMADKMSPYQTSLSLAERLKAPFLDLKLVQGGTHDYKEGAELEAMIGLFL